MGEERPQNLELAMNSRNLDQQGIRILLEPTLDIQGAKILIPCESIEVANHHHSFWDTA
jgi:hypothetical protein